MFKKARTLLEPFPTVNAFIWFQSSVVSLMSCQARFVTEGVATV